MGVGNIEFDPTVVSKGGLQGILEVRGLLLSHERITNKFGATRKKFGSETAELPSGVQETAPDQIEVSLEDVEILRMEEGAEEIELTDAKFSILINFAKPGQDKAHRYSQWNFGYTDTCKEVHGKFASEMEGEIVQLSKLPLTMTMRDRETKEDKSVETLRWCFVPVKDAVVDATSKIDTKLIGLNKAAAIREINLDNMLKRDPKVKAAVLAGEPVGNLALIDGVYRLAPDA